MNKTVEALIKAINNEWINFTNDIKEYIKNDLIKKENYTIEYEFKGAKPFKVFRITSKNETNSFNWYIELSLSSNFNIKINSSSYTSTSSSLVIYYTLKEHLETMIKDFNYE